MTKKYPHTLGSVIRDLRDLRAMSLQDVADDAGLTKAHVWELERGRAFNPTISTIWKLATALNCDPTQLAATALTHPSFNQSSSSERK